MKKTITFFIFATVVFLFFGNTTAFAAEAHDDPVYQGNAVVGGGVNNDSGLGQMSKDPSGDQESQIDFIIQRLALLALCLLPLYIYKRYLLKTAKKRF